MQPFFKRYWPLLLLVISWRICMWLFHWQEVYLWIIVVFYLIIRLESDVRKVDRLHDEMHMSLLAEHEALVGRVEELERR